MHIMVRLRVIIVLSLQKKGLIARSIQLLLH